MLPSSVWSDPDAGPKQNAPSPALPPNQNVKTTHDPEAVAHEHPVRLLQGCATQLYRTLQQICRKKNGGLSERQNQ